MATPPDHTPDPRPGARAILIGGLAAGTLDILDAVIFSYLWRGVSPTRVLQAIASGLLGRTAFDGGLATAALGLALHFFIALTAATVYVSVSRRAAVLVRHPVPSGIAYGIAVYFAMQHIVIPLSAFRAAAFAWPSFVNGVLIHIFGVGLPIALSHRLAGRLAAD